MGILAVIVVLLVLLLASTWSSAKSYFAKGRLAGMEEATLEIIRGVCSHYESSGQATPDHVVKVREEHLSIPGPALDIWRCHRRRLLAQGI